MRTRLEFVDGSSSFFKEFEKANLGLVKEGLNKTSSDLSEVYKKIIKRQTPSDWSSTIFKREDRLRPKRSQAKRMNKQYSWSSKSNKTGRVLTLLEKKKTFGQKYSKKDATPVSYASGREGNIADHVKWYTPKELHSLYAVVGGGHKGFRPVKWEKGYAKGYLKYEGGTSRKTLDILDKLNDGATIPLSRKQQRFLALTLGLTTMSKTIKIKPRYFAERARASGGQKALQTLIKMYNENFPKAITNIKYKVTQTKVG